MANSNRTLEEELAEKGLVASYIWKPSKLFAKVGDQYIPADVISDGTAEEVAAYIHEIGSEQAATINAVGAQELAYLTEHARDFVDVKNSLISTYSRMEAYFENSGMHSLATIMATAIANLNDL